MPDNYNSTQKIAEQERVEQHDTNQKADGLSQKLADFLNGKGGQAGCKRRNFKKISKS